MQYRNKCVGGGPQCERMFYTPRPLPDGVMPVCPTCENDRYRGTKARDKRIDKETK